MRTTFAATEFADNEIACWGYDGTSHRRRFFVCVFGIAGWTPGVMCSAVFDDFGNLVKVEAR